MNWDGEFIFGETWAAYWGLAAENSPHAHGALQIVFAQEGMVQLEVEREGLLCGLAFMIRPGATHAIVSRGAVGLVYIEPHSSLAAELLARMGKEQAVPLPTEFREHMRAGSRPHDWLKSLEKARPLCARTIDPRLRNALRALAADPTLSIADAARDRALSPSHLRTLAHRQLGVPLSKWLLWRKLERTARAIRAGATLSDAALAGGFSDQAHCARTMRRMFGVTPRTAQSVLQ